MAATPIDFREVWPKLRAYTDATGISFAECARRAVGAFIEAELEKNAGIREQFVAQMKAHLPGTGTNVASLIPRRRRGRPKSPATGTSKAAKP